MSSLPFAVQRYIDKQTTPKSWALAGESRCDFLGAVVIPSLAEGDSLFSTLQSLASNPPQWIERFLVVVVVNHGEQVATEDCLQNQADLVRLAGLAENSPLSLAWVDAASHGLELPAKLAGVGFSRKLGLDLALDRLDWAEEPLLVCLDADTLVEASYLPTVVSHFRKSPVGAAVLPFRHQAGADAKQQAAIERYELFLRSYTFGLHLAGSPYAFNSVGSAIACKALAYVRCGGMNCRKAGEDFYFLQKLAKTDGVEQLTGTTVFPQPRVSTRVPFGTGRSMARLLEGDARAVLFYPVEAFRVLSDWLQLVEQNLDGDAQELLACAAAISVVLADYLESIDWQTTWPGLQVNHQTGPKRLQAFHAWFDGFRTMRLIHLLCDSWLYRGEPEEIMPEYFSWAGLACPETLVGMLEELRHYEDT